MTEIAAVRDALDLMHVPSRVRLMRCAPLPDGVSFLLRIAAGDEDARSFASNVTGRSDHVIQSAASFFIEQALLFPEADSYRVLGATPQSSAHELRQNMAFLLRWLHPDLNSMDDRSVFTTRVTRAWEDLKSPDRRKAYDATRNLESKPKNSDLRKGRSRLPRGSRLRKKRLAGHYGIDGRKPRSLRGLLRRLFSGDEQR